MSWIVGLIAIIKSIMDRLPGRLESLRNQRDSYKQELHDLQYKKPFDDIKYSIIANKLQLLEKRVANAGG